jgi:methyl-accepting chemotaxis protein
MFKNLKLSAKMSLGFGVLIFISGILGYVSWMGLSQVSSNIDLYRQGNQGLECINKCAQYRRDFAIKAFDKDSQGKNAVDKWNLSFDELVATCNSLVGSKGISKADKDLVQSCLTKTEPYKASFTAMLNAKTMRDEAYAGWGKFGGQLFTEIANTRSGALQESFATAMKANDVAGMTKLMKIQDALNDQVASAAFNLRLASRQLLVKTEESEWTVYQDKLKAASDAAAAWAKLASGNQSLEAAAAKISDAITQYAAAGDSFHKGMLAKDVADKDMATAAAAIVDGVNTLQKSLKDQLQSLTARTNVIMISMALSGIVLGIILAIVITRSIVGPITKIIAGLTEGSEQVSSASNQVSAASQSLAEGATEQAAGLEETSSSLEEMSSMTKQNAENAQQAAGLANTSRTSAASGAEAMTKMNQAINQIQKSSDETAKIIKVIDEIAFQTNLLALNAAVEAARAGEAGKGFAVVAEEVRNLAMRSAEAAKNTSAMIEDSVKNSKNGVDITNEVAKVLNEIVGSVSKTADLVNEIAASSQEQAKGIDQVNVAVAQMDKVTQSNAANAEESASASEELNAQAQSMNEIVNELVMLVGGANADRNSQAGSKKAGKAQKLALTDHTFHNIIDKGSKKQVKAQKSEVHSSAKKLIPLESETDDLKNF